MGETQATAQGTRARRETFREDLVARSRARIPRPDLPPGIRAAAFAAIVTGGALIVATASIHLHLWLTGYRYVPRLGLLFMAQAVTGFVVGPLVALARHGVLVLGGAIYMAASAGGLLLSATVGFVGIHDGLGVPWAAWSLAVELLGFVLLSAGAAVALYRR